MWLGRPLDFHFRGYCCLLKGVTFHSEDVWDGRPLATPLVISFWFKGELALEILFRSSIELIVIGILFNYKYTLY